MSRLRLAEQATPATPPAGNVELFADTSGLLKQIDDAGTVAPPGGSPIVRSATVPLSSAQILLLNTAPVSVVSAPGAGFALVPLGGCIVFRAATTPYTYGGAGANGLSISWPSQAALNKGMLDELELGTAGEVISSIVDAIAHFAVVDRNTLEPASVALSDYENQPLVIFLTGANPTLGDGTALVTAYYVIQALT